jgi:hypothetical protein
VLKIITNSIIFFVIFAGQLHIPCLLVYLTKDSLATQIQILHLIKMIAGQLVVMSITFWFPHQLAIPETVGCSHILN